MKLRTKIIIFVIIVVGLYYLIKSIDWWGLVAR